MAKKRRRRNRSRSRSRRFWSWLGLGAGALGLAAAGLARRESDAGHRRMPEPPPSAPPPSELPGDATVSWIPAPAGTLRIAERHPEGGIAVLFVHGLGGRIEQWSALFHNLGPALRGVAFDLPGHGGSDGTDASVPAVAAAVGAVLDALELRRAVVVAHSLGCAGVLEYAGRHPQRIAGLLLVDPNADPGKVPEKDRRDLIDVVRGDPEGEVAWQFRQLLIDARPEVADRVLEQLGEVPGEVLTSAVESSLTYRPLPALDRYGGPVRFVVSDLNRLPGSLHVLRPRLPARGLGGAGHWLMMDRPDDVWTELVELLDHLRDRRRI